MKSHTRPLDVLNLPHTNTIHRDNRLGSFFFHTRRNLWMLRNLGILEKTEGWRSYQRKLFRLLLNPSPDMVKTIVAAKHSLFHEQSVLGVQVRCAGLLSDNAEYAVKLDKEDLKMVPKMVRLASYPLRNKKMVVLLSTDSKVAEEKLKASLQGFHVVTVKSFKRGHTTKHKASDDTIRRALLDLHLLAQSQALLVTQTSGFGEVAFYLSDVQRMNVIPVEKRHLMNE